MSPELAAALLGAFVGAIGGGAASLAGSVIVNRMQLRREMRIRIYDDLLPKLLRNYARTPSEIYSHLPYRTPEDFQTTMQEIERASVLAGRAEVKMATYLQYMITLRTLKYGTEATRQAHPLRQEDIGELNKQAREIGRALFELNDYLARKLV